MIDEYNEDYYDMLKQQNFEGLLNQEVQLDNARRRALKQTNANLAAMGMQSSGYGQTATNGIEGQYLSALQQADSTYQSSINDINMRQAEAQNASMGDSYRQFLTLMQDPLTITDQDSLNNLFNNYELLKDGKFDLEKATQLYGSENAKQLQYLYTAQSTGYSKESETPSNGQLYNYNNGNGVIYYYDKNNQTNSITLKGGGENGWNAENRTLNSAIVTGELQNDSYVALTNKKGNTIYVRYINGNLYYVSKQQYDNSSNKYAIKEYGAITKG